MRAVAWGLAVAALPALAEGPSDFAARAPIEIAAQDALQRIVLPFDVYRQARPDLGDLRIFNAKGDPVPMAYAGEAEPVRESPPGTTLPLFPVTVPQAPESLPSGIRIRAADGTLISLQGGKAAAKGTRIVAYYVDATALKEPVRAFEVDWAARPGTQVVHVTIDASEDLRSWSTVASGAPLVRLEHAGQVLGQRRVEIAPRKSKYYRVTGGGEGFELHALQAFPEERVRGVPLQRQVVRAARGESAGEFVFDLGARLPVEAVRLLPAETNTVVVGSLAVRDHEKQPWRSVTRLSVYRLSRAGAEVASPASNIPRTAARYWRLQLDAGSFASGMAPPELEVQWRPAQIVFVARGEPPFTLAVGKADAKPAVLPVSNFIPNYERLAELKLPEARVGAVSAAPPQAEWRQWIGVEANRRKVVLWAVLLLGVAVLAFMAWRLSGQIKHPPG